MERGGHGYRKLSSSGGGSGSEHNNGLSDTSNNNNNNNHASSDDSNECIVREQDRFMPIANVIRIMRRILPPHAKISDDAKETIQECVSEYISFITGEANERCQREQRKTITAEDVLWAMNKLGFDDYIEPLTLYLHRYRELEGDRGGSLRGVGDASLMLKRSAMEYGATPLSFSPRGFHVGNHHHHHGGFMAAGANGPAGIGGCFKEANGNGDGSSHAKCK